MLWIGGIVSDDEREEINQGLKEVDMDEIIPHEQVMAKYKKWM